MTDKRRGALIALEGLDRTGKTTQTRLLVSSLRACQIPTIPIQFPDRESATGQLIDRYLKKEIDFSDHEIHLLFSANRWAEADFIFRTLKQGITVVCDRYLYSGLAFSRAKGTLDWDWCGASDKGLPEPDLVVVFLGPPERKKGKRPYAGEERFENEEFQREVWNQFANLIPPPSASSYWLILEESEDWQSEEGGRLLLPAIEEAVLEAIRACGLKSIQTFSGGPCSSRLLKKAGHRCLREEGVTIE